MYSSSAYLYEGDYEYIKAMAKVYTETPRLLLRSWEQKDFKSFAELNSDPLVMRYFMKSLTEEESNELFGRMQQEFREFGYGVYAVEKKEDGAFIGFAGFHNITFDVDFAPGIEILWRFKHEEWNKGYATEAAKACLSYAKKNLPLQTIWSFTSLPNKASEKVMQKIGMMKIKEFPHPAVPDAHPLKQHVLYRIDICSKEAGVK